MNVAIVIANAIVSVEPQNRDASSDAVGAGLDDALAAGHHAASRGKEVKDAQGMVGPMPKT